MPQVKMRQAGRKGKCGQQPLQIPMQTAAKRHMVHARPGLLPSQTEKKNPMLDAHGTTSIAAVLPPPHLDGAGARARHLNHQSRRNSLRRNAGLPWERGRHPRGRAGNRGWEAVGNGKHQGQRLDARGRCSTRGQKRERKSRSLGQRDTADGSQGRTWQ
jgi:hypothetical protein